LITLGYNYSISSYSIINDLKLSKDGKSVYIAGMYYGTGDLDPTSGVHSVSSSSQETFIQKMDTAGNVTWSYDFEGYELEEIELDANDNIYTIGTMIGTNNDLDPDPVDVLDFGNYSGYDAFIQKLDSSGNLIWTKTLGETTGYTWGESIYYDENEHLYLTFRFEQSCSFDPNITGGHSLTASSIPRYEYDYALLKIDTSSQYKWVNQYKSGTWTSSTSIKVNSHTPEYIYVAGQIDAATDFDFTGNSEIVTTVDDIDVFLQKIDSSGSHVWVKQIGGDYDEELKQILVTDFGQIYLVGSLEKEIDVDLSTSSNYFSALSTFYEEGYMFMLDTSGSLIDTAFWAHGSSGNITLNDIFIDDINNLYTTREFRNTLDLDPGTNTLIFTSNGSQDIWAGRYGTVPPTPLRVNFLKLSISSVQNMTHLSWEFNTDEKCELFEIESSVDLLNCRQEGSVICDNQDNSSVRDINLESSRGLKYYRVKHIDYNGYVDYSKVVSHNIDEVKNTNIMVYPNPFKSKVNIVNPFSETQLYLSTLDGFKYKVESGEELSLQSLKPGIYFLTNGLSTVKLIKN
jgi:hypothetical protein